jgi:hypothetical protein
MCHAASRSDFSFLAQADKRVVEEYAAGLREIIEKLGRYFN